MPADYLLATEKLTIEALMQKLKPILLENTGFDLQLFLNNNSTLGIFSPLGSQARSVFDKSLNKPAAVDSSIDWRNPVSSLRKYWIWIDRMTFKMSSFWQFWPINILSERTKQIFGMT